MVRPVAGGVVLEFPDNVAIPVEPLDPPELFEPGQPVVLEGAWDGDVYASDRILVKHSEEYVAENDERVNYELDFPPGCST